LVYSEWLSKNALERDKEFRVRREKIRLSNMQMNVLQAKEETVLHGMIDKQTEIGR
jgi:hypothetical protein